MVPLAAVVAAEDLAVDTYRMHCRYDPDAICTTRNVDAVVEEIPWNRPLQLGGSPLLAPLQTIADGLRQSGVAVVRPALLPGRIRPIPRKW